jgi:hypothetical protein
MDSVMDHLKEKFAKWSNVAEVHTRTNGLQPKTWMRNITSWVLELAYIEPLCKHGSVIGFKMEH